MRFSLNWLTDYVDIVMSARELGSLLTRIGCNCEEIVETATDVIFDLEIGTNRPDLLGHLGLAREIAAATGAEFRPPRIGELPATGRVEDLTAVETLAPELCPRYTARVIRGVKVGPSPEWLVERLEAVGQRSVNNIVDVTNYVLFEYSQPLHSFDYDKLAGHRIIVRRARGGEQIVSIDGTKCCLDENMLVIADAEKAVAIAGIMGGLETEVTERTTNVLIESAQFDPLSIRMTSRKLALMSESNYRFERGVDPVGVDDASLRACQLILELAGGQLAEGVVDVWVEPFQPRMVSLRPERCCSLLGLEIPTDRQVEILERLTLSPRMEDGKIVCRIPSYRADLVREVDLVEEVARMEGYDKIPVFEAITHPVVAPSASEQAKASLQLVMSAAGFDEAITFAFLDKREAELFGQERPVCVDATVRRSNNVLRMTLIPSLLRACKTNQDAGNFDVSLYELAAVFPPSGEKQRLPQEYLQLGMVTTRDLRHLRGTLEALVQRLAPRGKLEASPARSAGFAEGETAELLLDRESLGVMGTVASEVREYYDLKRPVTAAAVNFEMLRCLAGGIRKYEPLPRFPGVQRDLSVVVDERVTWQQLQAAIDDVDQPMRTAVGYVTTYRGSPVQAGRKSVTISLTYRCGQRTLRSEEVDEQIRELLEALKKKFGAELRE